MLAEMYIDHSSSADIFLASDMLDIAAFGAHLRRRDRQVPIAAYFHENQITYPWSPSDPDVSLKRNNHYGFINFRSALVADRVFFNSNFHREAFLEGLSGFLRQFPDRRMLHRVEEIRNKSEVLPLGLPLVELDEYRQVEKGVEAVLLWNHRWEYDKDPEAFFNLLLRLKAEGLPFKLVVLGNAYQNHPPVFDRMRNELSDHLLHVGYASSRAEYAKWLWRSDILPVTSRQEFFGASVVEAIHCRTFPILPERLAYVEHVPNGWRSEVFYHSEEELFMKVRRSIMQLDRIRKVDDLRKYVDKYDWNKLVNSYDEKLKKLCQK